MICHSYDMNIWPSPTTHICDRCEAVDERSNHPNDPIPPRDYFPAEHRFVAENPGALNFSVEGQVQRMTRILFEQYGKAFKQVFQGEFLGGAEFYECDSPVQKLWREFAGFVVSETPELQNAKTLLYQRERDLLRDAINHYTKCLDHEDPEVNESVAAELKNAALKLKLISE